MRAIIQARMSSARFPAKVLAPLAGKPVIRHVVERVASVLPVERIIVATSDQASDDPLASYVRQLGPAVVRGPLDDVAARFRQSLAAHPCEWFIRICADSPLLDPQLLQRMIGIAEGSDADLVTNIHPRTFPAGQSLELVRSATFLAIDAAALDRDDREHVTRCYYRRPQAFRIVNVEREGGGRGGDSLAVDTPEDLDRLNELLAAPAAGAAGRG
jgi:spore coat polysaccharide biosynthesis protein SpsF